MTRIRILGSAALGAMVALAALAAHAGDDAYEAALTRAVAAKERALDINEPARWEEALRLFQDADAVRGTRECKYEIGFAAERLHRNDLAVEAYEAAFDLGLAGQPRGRAEAFVREHAAALARVSLHGGPSGLRVRVAGADRGQLPLGRPLVLFPGETRVELVDPTTGQRRTTLTIHATIGRLEVVELDALADLRAPPPAPPAPTPAPPPATLGGRPPQLEARSGDAPLLPLTESEPPPAARGGGAGHRALAWSLLGAGVAVAAASAVMIPVSFSELSSERSALAGSCAVLSGTDACAHPQPNMQHTAQDHVDAIATWKNVRIAGWVGLGAGVVSAAVGTVLLVRGGPEAGGGPAVSVSASHAAASWTFVF
jgi:hypothetical protein